jgi:hypothetical protein
MGKNKRLNKGLKKKVGSAPAKSRRRSAQSSAGLSVRTAILRNREVRTPRSLNENKRRKFQAAVEQFHCMEKLGNVHFSVVDDIGIGIRATRKIPAYSLLPEVWGSFGNKINKDQATTHRSAIEELRPERIRVYKPLFGPISFVNHACARHSNCTARYNKEYEALDYTMLRTKGAPVQQGGELCITYPL